MASKKEVRARLGKLHDFKIFLLILSITAISSLWFSGNLADIFKQFQDGKTAFTNVSGSSLLDDKASYGGVSWTDYNNDGWLDLFYPTSSGYKLYLNNTDGTFADTTKKAGLPQISGIA